MAYAADTKVPVEKSIAEIIGLIKKAGAERIAQVEEPNHHAIQFFLRDRMLRFRVAYPDLEEMAVYDGRGTRLTPQQRQGKWDQAKRQRARALLLVIKAKLESVESGVETFEEAFLSNIVTPEGSTVGDWLIPQIGESYRIGKMPSLLPMLPAPEGK